MSKPLVISNQVPPPPLPREESSSCRVAVLAISIIVILGAGAFSTYYLWPELGETSLSISAAAVVLSLILSCCCARKRPLDNQSSARPRSHSADSGVDERHSHFRRLSENGVPRKPDAPYAIQRRKSFDNEPVDSEVAPAISGQEPPAAAPYASYAEPARPFCLPNTERKEADSDLDEDGKLLGNYAIVPTGGSPVERPTEKVRPQGGHFTPDYILEWACREIRERLKEGCKEEALISADVSIYELVPQLQGQFKELSFKKNTLPGNERLATTYRIEWNLTA